MKSSGKHGKISSACEVVNISPFGVWILVQGYEYFLNHSEYPWFKEASVEDVFDVISPRTGHLHWRALDIDLHVDALQHPERYPLIAKPRLTRPRKTLRRRSGR